MSGSNHGLPSRRERPLRIGVMLDGMTVDAWVADVVEFILAHEQLELSLVVLDGSEPPIQTKRSLWERLKSNHALYYRLMNVDEQRAAANGWFHNQANLADCLTGLSTQSVVPLRENSVTRFGREDIDAIRDADLDILLRFGFGMLQGEVLDAARYGVWSYYHGDVDKYRGPCPGFWEVYEDNPVSGATLEMLTNSPDCGHVLTKTFIRTHPTSPMINLARLQEVGTILFRRAVEELLRHPQSPEEFLQNHPLSAEPSGRATLRKPSNRQMLMFTGRAMCRSLIGKLSGKNRTVQWSIGVWPHAADSLNGTLMEDIDWYQPRPDHFVADPCAVEHHDTTYLFVEEYIYEKQRAHISVMEYDGTSGFSEPRKILERDYHLSFPYVFEDDGCFYMIPEQLESGQVVLYRCEKFPDLWVEDTVLLDDFYGADTVVFRRDGLYWMFTTNGRDGNWDSNLNLFYSESLRGPYEPHPETPVSLTLYGSRMAGPLLSRNGHLIRSGQNCVEKYGGSLILHEIETLTPERYAERVIGEVRPNPAEPFSGALHTISVLPKLTIVDGLRYL